ncbi:MAG: FlgD immunoglobulin-like domain containing protein [Fibrobacterota bacterium]
MNTAENEALVTLTPDLMAIADADVSYPNMPVATFAQEMESLRETFLADTPHFSARNIDTAVLADKLDQAVGALRAAEIKWSEALKDRSAAQDSVDFGGGLSTYSSDSAEVGRNYLINEFGWRISDGGKTTAIIHKEELDHSGSSRGIVLYQNPVSQHEGAADIRVVTGKPAQVTITVYDMLGTVMDRQEIPVLTQQAGRFTWDLRSRKGVRVAAGSYVIMAKAAYRDGTVQQYRAVLGVRR